MLCLNKAVEILSDETICSEGERGLDVATGFDRTMECLDRAFDDLQHVAIAQLFENREDFVVLCRYTRVMYDNTCYEHVITWCTIVRECVC